MNQYFSYPNIGSSAYLSAPPFPHAVIKNCWNSDLLDRGEKDIYHFDGWDGEKAFYAARHKRYCGDMRKLPESVRSVITEASSPDFLTWLEATTGEKALIPDPYLNGGGVHSIGRDGFLKIHADFNWHARLHLYRRINFILYLNSGWDESWGGALEMWNEDCSACGQTVQPQSNTMVIFTTDDKSYHGHPAPLKCPPGHLRNSIALYYYSPIKPEKNFLAARIGTDYQPIAGDTFKRKPLS
jgi:hypothetical protein